MPKFGAVRDNVIITILLADSKEDAELLMGETCVELIHGAGEPGGGWTWDGEKFNPPAVPE
jgi:hypothetical protein